MTKMIVTIKDVTKTYGDVVAVNNVSLNIEKGKIIGLLGPNGSGKSTLIKMINGLLTPTSGDVLVYGNTVGVESKKVISYLPERTYLNLEYNVYETLEYFKDFYDDFDIEKARSEEHTSELQSRPHLVCRLLLEKKKKKKKINIKI